jgi:hypothetical protein
LGIDELYGVMGARVELGDGFVISVEELQGGVSTAMAVELYSAALATVSAVLKFKESKLETNLL